MTPEDVGYWLAGAALVIAAAVVGTLARRHWPLAWAATAREYRRRAESAEVRALKAGREADEAVGRMVDYQDRLRAFMCDNYSEWNRAAGRALRLVEDARPVIFAAMTEPCVALVSPDTPVTLALVRRREVTMLRLSLSVGMTAETPPELVAGLIAERAAEQVRRAILRQWQGQSLLLRAGQ